MDLKKLLPLLLILMYATSVAATQGNIEEACKAASDDLSIAGGCFDSDDAVTAGFTFTTEMILGFTGLVVVIVIVVIAAFAGLTPKKRSV